MYNGITRRGHMLSATGVTITSQGHSINNKAWCALQSIFGAKEAPEHRTCRRHVACTESKSSQVPITALGEEELQDAGRNPM